MPSGLVAEELAIVAAKAARGGAARGLLGVSSHLLGRRLLGRRGALLQLLHGAARGLVLGGAASRLVVLVDIGGRLGGRVSVGQADRGGVVVEGLGFPDL